MRRTRSGSRSTSVKKIVWKIRGCKLAKDQICGYYKECQARALGNNATQRYQDTRWGTPATCFRVILGADILNYTWREKERAATKWKWETEKKITFLFFVGYCFGKRKAIRCNNQRRIIIITTDTASDHRKYDDIKCFSLFFYENRFSDISANETGIYVEQHAFHFCFFFAENVFNLLHKNG